MQLQHVLGECLCSWCSRSSWRRRRNLCSNIYKMCIRRNAASLWDGEKPLKHHVMNILVGSGAAAQTRRCLNVYRNNEKLLLLMLMCVSVSEGGREWEREGGRERTHSCLLRSKWSIKFYLFICLLAVKPFWGVGVGSWSQSQQSSGEGVVHPIDTQDVPQDNLEFLDCWKKKTVVFLLKSKNSAPLRVTTSYLFIIVTGHLLWTKNRDG